jgi:intracellular sulfur oxidation DsrE/DsrF family protein
MKLSNEMINSYADGELQGSDRVEFESRLQHDLAAQQSLQEILAIKQQLAQAYRGATAPTQSPTRRMNYRLAGYAALLLLAFSGGWLGSNQMHQSDAQPLADARSLPPTNDMLQVSDVQSAAGKYILHIDSKDHLKFKTALDRAEALVTMYQAESHPYEIEVIANAGGLDMLREGETPYADRIRQLSQRYPNIRFIACSNAIERLQERGVKPNLIASVHQGETALDQVVKRMNQGWTYMKI